ncbi:MAG: amphi-Trp domain-containing protein [Anaerolineae bacterium]|nr:amphi-Trp domain-containing protein [Anaerolineae bacterium]
MAKKNRLFKSKEYRDLHSVADFLRQLADKLENNELTIQHGAESFEIILPERVLMGVKLVEKPKKYKTQHTLQIRLKWTDGDAKGGTLTLV